MHDFISQVILFQNRSHYKKIDYLPSVFYKLNCKYRMETNPSF